MEVSHQLTIGICATPGCGQRIRVQSGRFPGGVNDRGGFVIECSACHHKSYIAVSNPRDASYVESGGRVVGTWDNDFEGERDEVLNKHGLTETDVLSETLLFISPQELDDPLFVLAERPIYECPDCGDNLERLAYDELEKALSPINLSISNHINFYLKGHAEKPDTVQVALDVSCNCSTHRVSFFRDFSEPDHVVRAASDFTLAGPDDPAMLTGIDGIYTRNDCVEMFKKVLLRWRSCNRLVMLVVPFIGFDYPNREEDKLQLWNMVLGYTNADRTLLVTRRATYNSFKKTAQKKGLDLDVLKKYGLLAQLLEVLDQKGALFKTESHAKFYAAIGPEITELLSGSFNIHSGEYVENLLFKTYPTAKFVASYLLPLGVLFDLKQTLVTRNILKIDLDQGQVAATNLETRV